MSGSYKYLDRIASFILFTFILLEIPSLFTFETFLNLIEIGLQFLRLRSKVSVDQSRASLILSIFFDLISLIDPKV